MLCLIGKVMARMKEYNRKARALHSGPSNTDQKVRQQDPPSVQNVITMYGIKLSLVI